MVVEESSEPSRVERNKQGEHDALVAVGRDNVTDEFQRPCWVVQPIDHLGACPDIVPPPGIPEQRTVVAE